MLTKSGTHQSGNTHPGIKSIMDQPPLLDPSSAAQPPKLNQDNSAASHLSINTSLSNAVGRDRDPRSGDPRGQRSSSISSINRSAHRQSFAESLRNSNAPASPRDRKRHSSISQLYVQDLLNNPPLSAKANPRFAGREWRDITVGELVNPDDVMWIEMDGNVEHAAKLLNASPLRPVLIRETAQSKTAVSTFNFSDLLAYLLVIIGLAKPDDDMIDLFNTLMSKQQMEKPISLREIQPLCHKETQVNLPATARLSQAMQVMGSGIHQILVTDENVQVVGIVSQLQLVHFFWNEGVNFPTIDRLYQVVLKDLGVRTKDVISINSDAPLAKALVLMNDEGVTSVAVVDNGQNVVGNISVRDVRHLTSHSSANLFGQSCMHFISVILNERGVEEGRDAVPVFYVNPYSTLAHTVAKVVATNSHRMWIVESESPSPTQPATPVAASHRASTNPSPATSSRVSMDLAAALPASALAGKAISGKLSGVISLTDILNIFAKYTGLNPADPGEQRARRRRSSSTSQRPKLESRPSDSANQPLP